MNHEPFHAHLDECSQCMNHPFDLCPAGAALMLLLKREFDGSAGPLTDRRLTPDEASKG